MGTEELTIILQMSIAPVALISGVGLLLLSMTNRLGRTIDRARALAQQIRAGDAHEHDRLAVQIRILYRRSRILRLSIVFATVSILCASVIVLWLFAMYSFHARLYVLVMILWLLAIASLLASLVLFIHDITVSLGALRLNIGEHLPSDRD